MPKKNTRIKSVTARQRKKQGAKLACMLRGNRGTGKSRFTLDVLKMHVDEVYFEEYGEHIDWLDPISRRIEKIAPKILMCVIDFDMEGQEQLIERMTIMPDEISDCWNKWPVTGSPEDAEEYEHIFEDAQNAMFYYLKELRAHQEKYPEGRRILILEDLAEVYDAVLDHFFFVTTKGRVKSFKDQFVKQTAKKVEMGKDSKVPLFQLGQRDTFGVVNLEYKGYIQNLIRYKRDYDYSFYCTTRTGFKKDEDTGEIIEFSLGRSYLVEGYLDLIVTFKKPEKTVRKKNEEGKMEEILEVKFVVNTTEGAKNRLSPDFWMTLQYPNGAKQFFDRLKQEREDEDKRLIAKPKKGD